MDWRKTEEEFPLIGSSNLDRSPGLHLSDVIRSLADTLQLIKKAAGWDMDVTWGVGLLWEELLTAAYGATHAPRLGEIVVDGIIMTPDGLSLDGPRGVVLEEYKATWRSNRNPPYDNLPWGWQIKSYMRSVGTLEATMRILYIVGNWKGSGPIYEVWNVTASPHELEENWTMILNHARWMRDRGLA